MKNLIMTMFLILKEDLKKGMKKNTSKISFTSDIWTSPTQEPFMSVTAHFVDQDWRLQSYVIAFRYIPGSHTGRNIADTFVTVS
jgi:hypothetical protein